MATKDINPFLKIALDIGPLIVYFWAFKAYADAPLLVMGQSYQGIVAAMVLFIPALLVTMLISYILTKEVSPIHIFSLVMIAILGGLTIYFNNETFTKLRPTIVNLLFGLLMLGDAYVFKRGMVKLLLGRAMNMTAQGWHKLTLIFAANFLVQAGINEIVRNFMSDQAFVFWDTFGQLIVGIVVLFGGMMWVSKEVIHNKESENT